MSGVIELVVRTDHKILDGIDDSFEYGSLDQACLEHVSEANRGERRGED